MGLRVCGILWRSFGRIVGSREDVSRIRFLYNHVTWDLVPAVCCLIKLYEASTYWACTGERSTCVCAAENEGFRAGQSHPGGSEPACRGEASSQQPPPENNTLSPISISSRLSSSF
jgi:hypothetical protein